MHTAGDVGPYSIFFTSGSQTTYVSADPWDPPRHPESESQILGMHI